MKPETIVIKPTFKCVGNCIGCSSRQNLYNRIKGSRKLKLEDYFVLFFDLKELGTKKIVFSGGEPLLYPGITELVKLAKGFGFDVLINTTGYGLTDTLLDNIKESIDGITFSLNGHDKITDSKIRNPLLFDHTIKGIKKAVKTKEFFVNINTIINRYNHSDIDKIVSLVSALGAHVIHLSYVEGDWVNNNLLMTKEQEQHFNKIVKPRMTSYLKGLALPKDLKDASSKAISQIFTQSYENGLYEEKNCKRKENFSIILPNGDVHPCNIVEYVHEPVVGNILKERFKSIWTGESFSKFRNTDYKYCKYCPVNLRAKIFLKGV